MSANPHDPNDGTAEDRKLRALSRMSIPMASEAAKDRALDAALSAFDAAAEDLHSARPQAPTIGARLSSILTDWRKAFAMDIRIPIGATAIALIALPLGWQLYTSTSFTRLPPAGPELAEPASPVPANARRAPVEAEARIEAKTEANSLAAATPVEPSTQTFSASPSGQAQREQPLADAQQTAPRTRDATVDAEADALANMEVTREAAPVERVAAPPPPVGGVVAPSVPMRLAVPAPMQVAPESSADVFAAHADSPIRQVATDPVSTFSVDVDTASYAYARRMLEQGVMPSPDAVRVEEMINYFPYHYMPPPSAEVPFTPWVTVLPSPWNVGRQLVHIGIKGYEPPAGTDQASNLVFLLDTSGSMDEPDKLPLLKRAFGLLVEQLSGNDTVSIVAYAGSAGVVLEPTSASDKSKILAALDRLGAGGSTAGAEGIELAYRLAGENRVADGVNRVILATDGDFNVGISDPEALKAFIRTKRDEGVFLSVLGFGQGNLDDATMQALAQNGNGNASYIDSFREAQKVLVAQGGATLTAIAKDVKIQVEFNPALVREYRLVGYESRTLNREDFNNDKVDAGDVGAGHTVTAIYEITPVGAPGAIDPLRYEERPAVAPAPVTPDAEIGFVKLRYKLPNEAQSRLLETPIRADSALPDMANAVDDVRFAVAVAGFAQKLKRSDFVSETSWSTIRDLAQRARGADEAGYRAEFLQLVDAAAALSPGGEDVTCAMVDGERRCR